MFHEIMIDLREYRLRRCRLKWSRLYIYISFETEPKRPSQFCCIILIQGGRALGKRRAGMKKGSGDMVAVLELGHRLLY